MTTNKRWSIVSKFGRTVRNTATRDEARQYKTRTQRIFDTVNQVYVR